MKGIVLDTSALFYGRDPPLGYELVITPGVVRELNKEDMGERLEMLLATKLRIASPSARALKRVEAEAERTGDSRRLSETDREVLAAALDLGYQIMTDDFSIQNLARTLGIPYMTMDQRGISEIYEWDAKCRGCGKEFAADVRVCDICGSETRTKRKRRS